MKQQKKQINRLKIIKKSKITTKKTHKNNNKTKNTKIKQQNQIKNINKQQKHTNKTHKKPKKQY
ncbi:hypothetical protein [Pedobacter nyackensis]|uniref:hypothetical protein n=1 Tax=Pedobacter nyackensis TaxID=475255 RepID=UPI00292F4A5C|nr:hypothetical protein [Pedobacter nyackensis]